MPKIKTKGTVKKRLTVTSSGKIKRKRAFHSHLLTKKSAKRKRRLCSSTLVSANDVKRARKMMHV